MIRPRSINRAADWDRIRREGGTGRCDGIRVRALRRSSSDELPGRLGLRVSSRGPARSITRNRVRRRLREAWRLLPAPHGVDAIVHGDASLADKDFQDLTRALKLALERALEKGSA